MLFADEEGKDLKAVGCDSSEVWLPLDAIDIGSGTKTALAKITSSDRKKEVLMSIRTCLKIITMYLRDHLPLEKSVLRDLQCLHPLARKQTYGKPSAQRLCVHLKKITKTDAFTDSVGEQWTLYAADQELDDLDSKSMDICTY